MSKFDLELEKIKDTTIDLLDMEHQHENLNLLFETGLESFDLVE